jgi:hypothetical protein
MSVRDTLAAHQPITASEVLGYPDLVAIKYDELQELLELAHEAVHPQGGPKTREGLLDAIFGTAQEVMKEEIAREEGVTEEGWPEPAPVPAHNPAEEQMRLNALHLATQVVCTEIQASHGLESQKPDTVGVAESFLAFLRG